MLETINSIKNLKLLYFYNVYENTDTPGLKIVYDNEKVFSLDYSDEYFDDYILKVFEVYNNETQSNNIYIKEETTNTLLNLVEKIKNKEKIYTQNNQIIEFSRFHFQIKIIEEYIINTLKNILTSIFFENSEIKIESFNGYKNKFCLQYKMKNDDQEQENIMPIIVKHHEENKYQFETNIYKDFLIKINGVIEFSNHYVNITWKNSEESIIGRNVNNIDESKSVNLIKIKSNDEERYIYLNQNHKEKKKLDINYISNLEKLNITLPKNLRQITDNQYIGNHYENENNSDKFIEEDYQISTKNNLIKINLYKNIGYLRENNFKLITEKNKKQIILQLIKFENNPYIIKEITNLNSDIPKYSYEVYETNNIESLKDNLEIKNKIKINEYVETLEDIKKLILK